MSSDVELEDSARRRRFVAGLVTTFSPSLRGFLQCHDGGWFYSNLVRLFSVGKYEYCLAGQNREHRALEDDWPEERVVFATDGGIGVYYYDAAERRPDGECPIYYHPWESRRPERVGATLDDFLRHLDAIAPVQFAETE